MTFSKYTFDIKYAYPCILDNENEFCIFNVVYIEQDGLKHYYLDQSTVEQSSNTVVCSIVFVIT